MFQGKFKKEFWSKESETRFRKQKKWPVDLSSKFGVLEK